MAGAVQRRCGYGTVAALPPRHWLPGGAGGLQESLSLLLARSVVVKVSFGDVIDTAAKTITLGRLCIGHYSNIPALLSHGLFIARPKQPPISPIQMLYPTTPPVTASFFAESIIVFLDQFFGSHEKRTVPIVTIVHVPNLNALQF